MNDDFIIKGPDGEEKNSMLKDLNYIKLYQKMDCDSTYPCDERLYSRCDALNPIEIKYDEQDGRKNMYNIDEEDEPPKIITTEPAYSLDELIKKLEEIREQGEGDLNFPKAFYTLALEIKALTLKQNPKI